MFRIIFVAFCLALAIPAQVSVASPFEQMKVASLPGWMDDNCRAVTAGRYSNCEKIDFVDPKEYRQPGVVREIVIDEPAPRRQAPRITPRKRMPQKRVAPPPAPPYEVQKVKVVTCTQHGCTDWKVNNWSGGSTAGLGLIFQPDVEGMVISNGSQFAAMALSSSGAAASMGASIGACTLLTMFITESKDAAEGYRWTFEDRWKNLFQFGAECTPILGSVIAFHRAVQNKDHASAGLVLAGAGLGFLRGRNAGMIQSVAGAGLSLVQSAAAQPPQTPKEHHAPHRVTSIHKKVR